MVIVHRYKLMAYYKFCFIIVVYSIKYLIFEISSDKACEFVIIIFCFF
jgi:hypothetical protein